MTLSAIHNKVFQCLAACAVVCDIRGYDFVSYSQPKKQSNIKTSVVCDIRGYDFVSYSQPSETSGSICRSCL